MKENKLKILVVDDSATVRQTLADELTTLGYMVKTISVAEEALQLIKKDGFDIVFIDFKMPGISGLGVLDKIQKEDIDIIPIMMTAYESPATAVEAIEKGAYDYIIKPVKPGNLELIVKRALKRYEIEAMKRKSFATRTEQLKSFKKSSDELIEEIKLLKKEVNDLLKQLGKPEKYHAS